MKLVRARLPRTFLPRTFLKGSHPFLFAAFPVMFLYARNIESIPARDFWLALSGAIVVSAVLTLLGFVVLRSLMRACLVTSVLLLFAFSYGPVAELLEGAGAQRSVLWGDLWPVVAWSVLGLAAAVAVGRVRIRVRDVTRVFNIVGVSLVLMPGVSIATQSVPNPFAAQEVRAAGGSEPVLDGLTPERKPDIYYIILDRYAGKDALRRRFEFDNGSFLRGLKRRGMYVANSWANYPRTTHSLGSSLNMDYLDDLVEIYGADYRDTKPLFRHLDNPAVVRAVKSLGYRYVLIPSWWEHTASDPAADVRLELPSTLSPFARTLLETSIVGAVGARSSETLDVRREHWQITKNQFERLEQVGSMDGPSFVFAHLLLPHDPYVFRRDGSYRPPAEARSNTTVDNYLDQLAWANERVTELIDTLLSVPEDEQPVIILQSDEGMFPRGYATNGGGRYRWDLAEPKALEVKMNILNAYYFPGVREPALYRTISPVNSFRVTFNEYFDAGFPLLEDRVITWEDGDSPLAFHDRTEEVKEYRREMRRKERLARLAEAEENAEKAGAETNDAGSDAG